MNAELYPILREPFPEDLRALEDFEARAWRVYCGAPRSDQHLFTDFRKELKAAKDKLLRQRPKRVEDRK